MEEKRKKNEERQRQEDEKQQQDDDKVQNIPSICGSDTCTFCSDI